MNKGFVIFYIRYCALIELSVSTSTFCLSLVLTAFEEGTEDQIEIGENLRKP